MSHCSVTKLCIYKLPIPNLRNLALYFIHSILNFFYENTIIFIFYMSSHNTRIYHQIFYCKNGSISFCISIIMYFIYLSTNQQMMAHTTKTYGWMRQQNWLNHWFLTDLNSNVLKTNLLHCCVNGSHALTIS
jgi:hypothetical protein